MSLAVSEPASKQSQVVRCGKYQLIASLGQGGMADVFLSVAQGPAGFNKLQVIKRLRTNLAEEVEFLAMFLDEARLAARLSHRNVVQTNEVGEVDGQYFIAMEYLDGQPLNRIIRRNQKVGSCPLGIMLRIVADALAGLHYAHELADYDGTPLKIVHRDASPHNIFVTYEGETKVVDFGIAKAVTSSVETRTGLLKGKVPYMAPEQAAANRVVDRQADVFVLGTVLWEAVASRKMWEGCSEMDILRRLLQGDIPRLHDACPDVPSALLEICARATAPEPANRYATAAEMRTAILSYLDQSGQRAETEDVGRFVSGLFADKRLELKKKIDRQLSRLTSASAPTLLEDSLFETSTSLLPQINASMDSSEHTPSNQRNPSRSQLMPDSSRSSLKPPSVPSGVLTRSSGQAAAMAATAVVPASPSRHRYQLLGVALLAALATVVALRVTRKEPPAGEIAAPTESAHLASTGVSVAPAPPPTEPAPAAEMIELRVSAAPSSAALFLDGARLPSNPFSAKFPSDGSGHKLRAEASGYTSMSKIVIFDKDVTLNFELDQPPPSVGRVVRGRPVVASQPPQPPPPPPSPPPTVATATPTSAVTATPVKPRRSLDSSSPWTSQPAPAGGAPAKPKRPLDNPWGQ